ncbi:hypothetical protein [Nostoc sp.]|uniref:hypothetical protein n=1 Tax=Nostoc sp. TaxID=1180 RepID=UPI002FFCF179
MSDSLNKVELSEITLTLLTKLLPLIEVSLLNWAWGKQGKQGIEHWPSQFNARILVKQRGLFPHARG